ncbi:hypothetical protein MSAN_01862500 [Mycena sanguinolenta]|uniref:Transmembrane protein n=1 Tax=Mycena sanguinolenta TaxID=230812 RepID=A0A8H7CSZ6_9AGAR|nr:hypothetical protein MSAN_01862500 [Mycena sanguinolenta]
MANPTVTLIVDDRDATKIRYHCPVVTETVKSSYFRNTWTSIDSLSCGQESGWFSHTFNGTQTRIWASMSQPNQNYSVKIDGGPFLVQSGDGYFESPILEDGQHTVTYSMGDMDLDPSFDYLTVTAGPSTQLLGQTVIVDDTEIADYSGQWGSEPPTPFILRPSGLYQNTTHWTRTVGDTFTFQFNGNSVAVYGVVPNNTNTGNSTATYTVDGVSTVLPFPSAESFVQPMSQFFHIDLAAGTHTLVFNLTEIAPSHVFGIDFVSYNSSVNTLASGSTVQAPVASSRTKNHARIIAGAVVGALAGVALIILLLFLYRRSRSRKRTGRRVFNKSLAVQ